MMVDVRGLLYGERCRHCLEFSKIVGAGQEAAFRKHSRSSLACVAMSPDRSLLAFSPCSTDRPHFPLSLSGLPTR